MATKIITKNSSTASAAPVAADLSAGELAINTNDGKLFYKDSGGTVRTLASKDAASGTFTTLSASGNVTLSGGTANGVLYLNGSKVATSGSALTFDGTNLGIGVTPSAWSSFTGLQVGPSGSVSNSGTGTPVSAFSNNAYYNGTSWAYINTAAAAQYQLSTSQHIWRYAASGSGNITWSEAMRLDTSGNLGIGTSSPAAKLDVAGDIIGRATTLRFKDSGNTTQYGAIYADSTTFNINAGVNNLLFYSAGTERMRLDSSGNLGLGVTPSASWASDPSATRAIQLNGGSIWSYSTSQFNLLQNAVWNGSNLLYANTAAASAYRQVSGVHSWYNAPSGTAGNAITFTQAMTLDASGNLLLGATSVSGLTPSAAAKALVLNSTDATLSGAVSYVANGVIKAYHYVDSDGLFAHQVVSNAGQKFYTNNTERARIDSSGNLLVGTTSNNGRLSVKGSTSDSTANAFAVTSSSDSQMFLVRNDGYLRSSSTYFNTTASAANLNIDTNGYIYRSTSSLKYKTDVEDATHGLSDVMALRSVTYKGKTDGDKIFGGLIAEEVHAAGLTEFVQYAEDGSPDALAYGNMVSLCIKAIQEQQAIIEQLKADVAALKGA